MLTDFWPADKAVFFLPEGSARTGPAGLDVFAKWSLDTKRRLAKRQVRIDASRQGVDVLHVLYGDADLPFPRTSRRTCLVASVHQPISHLSRNQNRLALLKRQLSNVDLTIALSSEQRVFLETLLPGKRVEFVPHGVDSDFFRDDGEARDRSVLVSCGWYRDLELARGVVGDLARRDPELRIKAYGGGAASLAGASPRLEVLADLSDEQLRHEYCTCGLVFLPLKEAVANNALLEAMSCGAAVVAPALPAVSQYLGASDTCYEPALPPEDTAEFICRLIEKPILGPAPRTRALEFDWQLVARQMLTLHEGLCG